MTAITAVTTPATRADDLTDTDYRDIYDELRGYLSLADFIARSGSTVSRSWWSQYESGAKHLTTARRNELRRAVGVSEMAPDVLTAVANVTTEAAVWQVGEGAADRVIMVAQGAPENLNLRLNGGVYIGLPSEAQNLAETEVTPITGYRRAARPKYLRPCLSLDPVIRLQQLADLYAETLQAVQAAEEKKRMVGLYFTPPIIADFVIGSGSFLAEVFGNPPFSAAEPDRVIEVWLEPDDPEDYEPQEESHV